MTDAKRLAKEAQGLEAKLKWDHVPEHLKEVWRIRIEEINASLNSGVQIFDIEDLDP